MARRNVETVCEILRKTFEISSEINKSNELLAKGQLGYESHHLIGRLGDIRANLLEYEGVCDQSFEIQVRTALQHAWAENEHRIQFKVSKKDPELNKRFLRLAGIISTADEEFDRIYEIDERMRETISTAVSELEGSGTDVVEEKILRDVSLKFGEPVSDLVKSGRFVEAIQVYSEFIHLQPAQLTHFAGRAKARALSGDIDGALGDLESASQLQPNHPAIKNVLKILDNLIPDFGDEDED